MFHGTTRSRVLRNLGRDLRSRNGRFGCARGRTARGTRRQLHTAHVESRGDPARPVGALGDVGNREGAGHRDAVFDGYTARAPLEEHAAELDVHRKRLPILFNVPFDDPVINHEMGRLIAMLEPREPTLLAADARADHRRVAADRRRAPSHRCGVDPTSIGPRSRWRRSPRRSSGSSRRSTPRGLNTDNNWEPRIGELYAAHVRLARNLPASGRRDRRLRASRPRRLPEGALAGATATGDRTVRRTGRRGRRVSVVERGRASARRVGPTGTRRSGPLEGRRLRASQQRARRTRAKGERGWIVRTSSAGLESSNLGTVTACVGALAKLPRIVGEAGRSGERGVARAVPPTRGGREGVRPAGSES